MKRAVLLVTRSDDNECVARVANALEKRGRRAIRLDSDRYPAALAVSTWIEARAPEAPPLQKGKAPPLQKGKAPPLQKGKAPPLQKGNAPPLQRGKAPPLQKGEAPSLQKGEAPPLQRGNAPPLQRGDAPPLQRGKAPPLHRGEAPPLQRGEAPPLQKGKAPLQRGNAPPLQRGNAPALQSGLPLVRRAIGGVDAGDIEAVWYRRFAAGASLPAALDDLRDAAVDESRRALYGFIAALPCPHVDTLEAVRRCDHKELQLVRAGALGLRIPRTLFTNDDDAARGFVDDVARDGGAVITKMQSSFAVMRDEREHVVFTSPVERHHLDAGGLDLCPMMFQERIEKSRDVRAVVVGDRVLAAAVDAGPLLDWRKEGLALVDAWRPHRLPRPVERALLSLVHELGLRYAACDLAVDAQSGEHVFLEANAGGEWLWLDDMLHIGDALADELTRAA